MDAKGRCGDCLWYGAPDRTNKLGECQNADSAFYWNRGEDRESLHVAADGDPCKYYKSARVFLGEDSPKAKRRVFGFLDPVRTGLFQLSYPIVLSAMCFYYIFRESPESLDRGYTRAESDKLSL